MEVVYDWPLVLGSKPWVVNSFPPSYPVIHDHGPQPMLDPSIALAHFWHDRSLDDGGVPALVNGAWAIPGARACTVINYAAAALEP
jgi:hypothetical protein